MNDSNIARVASPRRDIAGENPEIARLSAMVVALLGELAITRERLDTVERIAEQAGAFDRAAVEAYRATGTAEAERDAIRKRLIGVVMRPFQAEVERAAAAYCGRSADIPAADDILAKEAGK